jgi:hypothetical protein
MSSKLFDYKIVFNHKNFYSIDDLIRIYDYLYFDTSGFLGEIDIFNKSPRKNRSVGYYVNNVLPQIKKNYYVLSNLPKKDLKKIVIIEDFYYEVKNLFNYDYKIYIESKNSVIKNLSKEEQKWLKREMKKLKKYKYLDKFFNLSKNFTVIKNEFYKNYNSNFIDLENILEKDISCSLSKTDRNLIYTYFYKFKNFEKALITNDIGIIETLHNWNKFLGKKENRFYDKYIRHVNKEDSNKNFLFLKESYFI